MSRKYFGTDGIRGEFGVNPLTKEFFTILGVAVGKSLLSKTDCGKKIIIGSDTRKSCNEIIDLISIGLNSAGYKIDNAGVVPTPAISFYTKRKNYALGIMVSASHNLYKDNGIKIFNNSGFKISIEDENYIEDYIEIIKNQDIQYNNSFSLNDISEEIQSEYIDFCLGNVLFNNRVSNNLTLDLANGANFKIAKKVFTKAGYDIKTYNDKPNGKNINDKCGSTYLKELPKLVINNESQYGISMDGDGDRIVIVNKKGKIIDGDDILYTIIRGKILEGEVVKGVVGTTMTNCALEDFLSKKKISFIRANVGDKYILEKMLENKYDLGGETSGHILMLDKSTSGDSIIATLQFLYYSDILEKNNINNLLDKYPQKITNLHIDKDLPDNICNIAIKKSVDKFSVYKVRLVIRKSGTENCIRVMVEAKDEDLVDKMSFEISKFIKDELKKLL